jgi:hypothetical protein
MISDVERPDPGNRIFRIALAVSLVVHLLVGFLVYESSSDVRRVLARFAHPQPKPTDEVVTLSTAIRIEKRAKAQPQPHVVRVAKQPPQRPQPRVVPQPEAAPAVAALPPPVVARTPVPQAPSREKHELAKPAPSAPPEPPKTTVAKLDTTTPTAPPATPKPERAASTPRPQAPPQTVAEIQHPEAVTQPAPPRHPERSSRSAQFSEAQLEQIQHDLAKTIVQARVENNPLSNVQKPVTIPAAVHRSAIDFAALAGDMREAQGLCDPIRGWQADGWDYYYATCTIEEPDGSIARKAMPWPVRWRPRYDPWTGYARIATGPMPLPPPGWRPTGPIDPDFIPYLRKNGYPI